VARSVKRRVGRIPLPPEMKLVTVADQSRFIQAAIGEVVNAAVLGGILAIIVLFLFLRDLRTTLVIGLSIPVSVLATFIVMYRFGLSLNLMSLGGLALGVGMLVDNAIVVLESIFRRREAGADPNTAASRGASTVARAVTASTLTTIAVFFPLVFVEGLAGQLIRDQALTISISLLASLIVALTLIPTLSALLSRRRVNAEGAPLDPSKKHRMRSFAGWAVFVAMFIPRAIVKGVQWVGRKISPVVDRVLGGFDAGYQRLENAYPVALRTALTRPGRVMGFGGVAFVSALAVALFLPRDLLPAFSQGEFRFNVGLPDGTALHVTDETLARVASAVEDDPSVRFVHTSSGQTDLSEFAGSAREANRGQVSVLMDQASAREAENRVATKLRDAMGEVPGLTYEYERPALLRFRAPIEVEIYAYNLDTLASISDVVARRLEKIDGLEDIETTIRTGDPEVQISFDRQRLAMMGLDPSEASRLVRNAVQGEAATQFNDLERKIDVRVRASEEERSVISRLANLEVGRNEGRVVLLASVADVRVERGPGDIRRIGQQRAAVVTANLKNRDLGSAAEEIEAAMRQVPVPPNARIALSGQNTELGDSFGSLRFALLLAVFLVYLVMASQFESLLHPFVVMFSIPLALIGVVAALLVTGTTLSVMVLIGMVVLAGIVVNNAIVLVDYANQLRKEGKAKVEALIEAGQTRLRPILMTTLTTVLGLTPMALGFGEGAELRVPLALTLIGGLTFAALLTLFIIPAIYATLDRSK